MKWSVRFAHVECHNGSQGRQILGVLRENFDHDNVTQTLASLATRQFEFGTALLVLYVG